MDGTAAKAPPPRKTVAAPPERARIHIVDEVARPGNPFTNRITASLQAQPSPPGVSSPGGGTTVTGGFGAATVTPASVVGLVVVVGGGVPSVGAAVLESEPDDSSPEPAAGRDRCSPE